MSLSQLVLYSCLFSFPIATVPTGRIVGDPLFGDQIELFPLPPVALLALEDGENFNLVVRCIYPLLLDFV